MLFYLLKPILSRKAVTAGENEGSHPGDATGKHTDDSFNFRKVNAAERQEESAHERSAPEFLIRLAEEGKNFLPVWDQDLGICHEEFVFHIGDPAELTVFNTGGKQIL